MVIKHAEEKYHDIHANYRDLATQLHTSWKYKYEELEKENNRLMSSLTTIVKQNRANKTVANDPIEQQSSNDSENEHDITSPIAHIPIENIAESLDLDDNQLNELTKGNNSDTNDKICSGQNGHHTNNKNDNQQSSKSKLRSRSKSKRKRRVVEAYID